jgi:hypothetical protein
VEAAVEDGPGVHELPLEHVGVGVVEPHRLQAQTKPNQVRSAGSKSELGFNNERGNGGTGEERRRLTTTDLVP